MNNEKTLSEVNKTTVKRGSTTEPTNITVERTEEISEIMDKDESVLSEQEYGKKIKYLESLLVADELTEEQHLEKRIYEKKLQREEVRKAREEEVPEPDEAPKTESVPEKKVVDLTSIKTKKRPRDYMKYIHKNLVDKASTSMVTLPFSNYSAYMMGMTTDELQRYAAFQGTPHEVRLAKYKMVYDKIKKTSIIGNLSFDDWLDITLASEFDILLFGIYKETYADINEFPFECLGVKNGRPNTPEVKKAKEAGKAHGEFLEKIVTDDLILLPEDEDDQATTIKRIRDIVKSDKYLEDVKEESEGSKVERMLLDESGFIVDIARPTLRDQINMGETITEEIAEKHPVGFELGFYTDTVYIPDGDEYIPIEKYLDIIDVIALLNDDDVSKLNSMIDDYNKKSTIHFGFENIRCPECQTLVHERREMSIENILFTIHLRKLKG